MLLIRNWRLVFCITVVGCLQKAKTPDCTHFKNGKFEIIDKKTQTKWLINRFDTIQTEVLGDTLTMIKVRWISSCEYETIREYKRSNKIDSNSEHVIFKYINQTPLRTKIISVSKNYFVFESRKENENFVYSDTMWVLK